MPRGYRVHFPGAHYHVITRGNNRQQIFESETDYKRFLVIVKTIKEENPFYLFAYCLMPNHIHLLIKVKQESLSKIMQRILTRYVVRFNLKYKRSGHLFQGRYQAKLCVKDSYLLELVRYIHLNPVRAGLVKNVSDWKWSGHQAYLGTYRDPIIDANPVLSQLSLTPVAAQKSYIKFLADGLKPLK